LREKEKTSLSVESPHGKGKEKKAPTRKEGVKKKKKKVRHLLSRKKKGETKNGAAACSRKRRTGDSALERKRGVRLIDREKKRKGEKGTCGGRGAKGGGGGGRGRVPWEDSEKKVASKGVFGEQQRGLLSF